MSFGFKEKEADADEDYGPDVFDDEGLTANQRAKKKLSDSIFASS